MRAILFLLLGVSLLGGCAEVVQGPRYVPYTPERFYIRHAPVVDGADRVNDIAAAVCRDVGKQATLIEDQQYYPFDLRYATYRCLDA